MSLNKKQIHIFKSEESFHLPFFLFEQKLNKFKNKIIRFKSKLKSYKNEQKNSESIQNKAEISPSTLSIYKLIFTTLASIFFLLALIIYEESPNWHYYEFFGDGQVLKYFLIFFVTVLGFGSFSISYLLNHPQNESFVCDEGINRLDTSFDVSSQSESDQQL